MYAKLRHYDVISSFTIVRTNDVNPYFFFLLWHDQLLITLQKNRRSRNKSTVKIHVFVVPIWQYSTQASIHCGFGIKLKM